MRYEDINKKFTEVVADYMANGWTFNTASMSGIQGDIAKVDLTDGKDIIRIRLAEFGEFANHEWVSGFEIIVGKCTDAVFPNDHSKLSTIWNKYLDEIERIRFHRVDNKNYRLEQ